MQDETTDEFCLAFEAAIPQLKQIILNSFQSQQTSVGFRSIWEFFEEVISPILISFFQSPPLNIDVNDITIARSKSTYPDLKVAFGGNIYAIDVKSGEANKDPWYDFGRLDTYADKHFGKYKAEFSVTVQWAGREKENLKITNVYIERTAWSVGYKAESEGVKYRPYDGKLRPKSWSDFEAGKIYWPNLERFKQAIEVSKFYRWRTLVSEWYEKMPSHQRDLIKQDISKIDAGEHLVLDADIKDETE